MPTSETWIALLALTGMEVVLGIDNIVFISILVGRLPDPARSRIRSLGISIALLTRLGLLFSISWVMSLTQPLFSAVSQDFSGRDLILLGGGLFLLGKATFEIHAKVEGDPEHGAREGVTRRAGELHQAAQAILFLGCESHGASPGAGTIAKR